MVGYCCQLVPYNISPITQEIERKVQFEEMFPWEFSQAIDQAPICYLPLGVLEWHGEHNAVGLDPIEAHAV
jgi:creatinine amidohydrolase